MTAKKGIITKISAIFMVIFLFPGAVLAGEESDGQLPDFFPVIESEEDSVLTDTESEEDPVNNAVSDLIPEILEALDDPDVNAVREALQNGEEITQGTVSNIAAGLQKTLVDFGCDISIDGSAGPGTFGALNQVLEAFGLEQTETVDAELYDQLLPLLLLSKDQEDEYGDLLRSYFEDGKESGYYEYLKGCAYYTSEEYYRALEAFQDSGYGDYEDRAAACVQDWPGNGEFWHNSSVYGADMYLSFDVNSYDESEGMCFYVYTEDGTLGSILFLTGSGSVTTMLPGGNYRIKNASGYEWYGWKDAFGRNGNYEFMSFREYDEDEYLTWLGSGYEWTITVNVEEGDPNAANVGAIGSDWENWSFE